MVSCILIGEGGVTLPLYIYSLKSGQIKEKEGSQKKLHKRSNGLAKTKIYQDLYTSNDIGRRCKDSVLKEADWFNRVKMEEIFTNLLFFEEKVVNQDGTSETIYKLAWICSKKIFHNKCFTQGAVRIY